MASLEDILKAQAKRLTEVPDEFLSKLDKIQKELLPQVNELLALLERDGQGFIKLTKKNIQLTNDLKDQLKIILNNSDYVDAVGEFAKEFRVQELLANEMFAVVFPEFVSGGVASELVKQAQRKAVEVLLDSIGDRSFASAITEQVELAIANNASFTETLLNVQNIVIGDSETDGKIKQYAQQIAGDSFAISDRSYISAVSNELGAEWFLYLGGEIETSRQFCIERHGKFFHYKEIEAWGRGEKTQGMSLPDSNGDWAGKIPGTNEKTIFSNAGGYGPCRHLIVPQSINRVPIEDIRRNMANGNFTPSDFEVRELGL